MKKLITFTAILFSHVFAFSQTEHKTFYDNGNPKIVGQFDENGKCTGEWNYYLENGQLEKKGSFINQQQIGEWIFYKDGYLYNIAYFENGLIQTDKWFYPSGKKFALGFYKNGEKSGKWEYFEENGTVKLIERYKNGKENGNCIWYFPDQKLACKGAYKNGLKTGKWKYYYENGNLKNVSHYSKGKKNGKWKFYHENGTLSEIGKLKNGDKKGLWKFYDEQGKLTETRNYD